MSSQISDSKRNKLYSRVKWQLTALSGALTTGLIVMLES